MAPTMTDTALQDIPPFEGHSPDQERPLGGYGALIATFFGLSAGFAGWIRATHRELPEQIGTRDLVLITIATHKLTRLIARDRVTSTVRAPFTRFQDDAGPSEVEEAARGHGLRRAVGELIICPYCLAMWVGGGLVAGIVVAPRPTRLVAGTFSVVAGADLLQIGYSKAQSAL